MAKKTRWNKLGTIILRREKNGWKSASIVVFRYEMQRLRRKGFIVEELQPYEHSEDMQLYTANIFWFHLSPTSVRKLVKEMLNCS